MKKILGFCLLLILSAVVSAGDGDPSSRWDFDSLSKVPQAQWSDPVEKTVKDRDGKDMVIQTQKVWYAGQPYQGRATRVFAFVSRPVTASPVSASSVEPGKFPGMVLVHGGGGTAFSSWTEMWASRGYAAIAMDLGGDESATDNSTEGKSPKTRMADGYPGQGHDVKFMKFTGEDDYQNVWTYNAVANIVRGCSLLTSLDCVDSNRIGMTGISWGGYLSWIVPGVDKRIRVSIPVYGCGDLAGPVARAWGELHREDEQGRKYAELWSSYFDPMLFPAHAACRYCIVSSTDDYFYPMESATRTYQDYREKTSAVFIQGMLHSHWHGWIEPEIANFADAYLDNGGKLMPLVNARADVPYRMELEPDKKCLTMTATVDGIDLSELKNYKLRAWYSTDQGGYSNGKWLIRKWLPIENVEIRNNGQGCELFSFFQATNGNQSVPVVGYMELTSPDGLRVTTGLYRYTQVQ